MNKQLFFIATLAAFSFTACQKDKIQEKDQIQETWIGAQLSPSTPAVFHAIDIAQVGTDYVILSSAASGSTTTTYATRIDASGQLLWEKYYSVSGQSYVPERLILTHDGNLLIGGISQQKAYLTKVAASSGDVVWEHFVSGAASNYTETLKDLTVDATTGDIFLVGSTNNIDTLKPDYSNNKATDLTDCWTVKMDSDGNMLWSRISGFVRNDNFMATSFQNNILLTSGTTQSSNNGALEAFPFAVRYVSGTGNISSMGNAADASGLVLSMQAAVWDAQGNSTVVAAANNSIYLSQFDVNASPTQLPIAIGFSHFPTVRQITRFNDGSFVLMGNVTANGKTNIWLAHLSATFQVLSETTYGEASEDEQVGRFVASDLSDATAPIYFSASRQDGATLLLGVGTAD